MKQSNLWSVWILQTLLCQMQGMKAQTFLKSSIFSRSVCICVSYYSVDINKGFFSHPSSEHSMISTGYLQRVPHWHALEKIMDIHQRSFEASSSASMSSIHCFNMNLCYPVEYYEYYWPLHRANTECGRGPSSCAELGHIHCLHLQSWGAGCPFPTVSLCHSAVTELGPPMPHTWAFQQSSDFLWRLLTNSLTPRTEIFKIVPRSFAMRKSSWIVMETVSRGDDNSHTPLTIRKLGVFSRSETVSRGDDYSHIPLTIRKVRVFSGSLIKD